MKFVGNSKKILSKDGLVLYRRDGNVISEVALMRDHCTLYTLGASPDYGPIFNIRVNLASSLFRNSTTAVFDFEQRKPSNSNRSQLKRIRFSKSGPLFTSGECKRLSK